VPAIPVKIRSEVDDLKAVIYISAISLWSHRQLCGVVMAVAATAAVMGHVAQHQVQGARLQQNVMLRCLRTYDENLTLQGLRRILRVC
jgi:hypothetical protein